MQRFVTIIFMAMLTFGSIASAQQSDLLPDIPKALFELETPHPDDIRENHMNYLRHDRDATMRLGDRNIEFSLKSCVDCHAVRGPDASFITVDNPSHFCAACHVAAAVRIDCFQCHNSRPDMIDLTSYYTPDEGEGIAAYLEEISE